MHCSSGQIYVSFSSIELPDDTRSLFSTRRCVNQQQSGVSSANGFLVTIETRDLKYWDSHSIFMSIKKINEALVVAVVSREGNWLRTNNRVCQAIPKEGQVKDSPGFYRHEPSFPKERLHCNFRPFNLASTNRSLSVSINAATIMKTADILASEHRKDWPPHQRAIRQQISFC